MTRWEREQIPVGDSGWRVQEKSENSNAINLFHPNVIAYQYWVATDCLAELEDRYFDGDNEEDHDLPFKIDEFHSNPHLQRMFLDDLTDELSNYSSLEDSDIEYAIDNTLDVMRESERCGSLANVDPMSPYVYELDVGVRMSTLWDNFEDYEQHVLYVFDGDEYGDNGRRLFVSETLGDVFYKFVDGHTLTTLRPMNKRQLFDVDADTWRA